MDRSKKPTVFPLAFCRHELFPYIQIVLPSYAALASVGGIGALLLVLFRLEKYGIAFTDFIAMGIFSGICAIAGSKLLFALTQIGELLDSFSIRGLFLLVWRSARRGDPL